MNNKGFWKIGFFIALVLLIILIGVLAFLLGRGNFSLNISLPEKTSDLIEEPLKTAVPTPDMSLEIEAIKDAVYEKTGLTKENADVSVDEYTLNHAKGGVKEKEAVGGAYFIAAKVGGEWICVYDGQAHPSCELIEPYDFPSEMVPECLDSSNNVVKR